MRSRVAERPGDNGDGSSERVRVDNSTAERRRGCDAAVALGFIMKKSKLLASMEIKGETNRTIARSKVAG